MLKIQLNVFSKYELHLNIAKTILRAFFQTHSKLPRVSSYPVNFSCSYKILPTLPAVVKSIQCIQFCCAPVSVDRLADSLMTANIDKINPETRDEILRIFRFLLSHGCTIHDIKETCLEHLNTNHASYMKMVFIVELHQNITQLMPLMSLSLACLRRAAKQARDEKGEMGEFPNRIEYLSHHLETPVSDLIPALAKHSSLLTMTFQRLERKMTILKNAQISSEYIAKDLWIFNYNETLLVTRISLAQKENVELKPWMLRCSEKIFEAKIAKYSATQQVLNGTEEITFLARKLDCSEDYVEHIMERSKQLKAVNIPKVSQILNFLYEKGYSPQEVRLFPRVFCSSVQTLNKRFEEFRILRNTLPTISQLCISSKKFQNKFWKVPTENLSKGN